jgi:hypothetical protein
MSDALSWMFIIVAAAAVIAGLGSLWVSLSLGLSDRAIGDVRAQLTSDARRALLSEKDALLQELRDIAFEHDAGKLSDRDFEELNDKLRAQARHILHELDESAEEFRGEAEELIAMRLDKARDDA